MVGNAMKPKMFITIKKPPIFAKNPIKACFILKQIYKSTKIQLKETVKIMIYKL